MFIWARKEKRHTEQSGSAPGVFAKIKRGKRKSRRVLTPGGLFFYQNHISKLIFNVS